MQTHPLKAHANRRSMSSVSACWAPLTLSTQLAASARTTSSEGQPDIVLSGGALACGFCLQNSGPGFFHHPSRTCLVLAEAEAKSAADAHAWTVQQNKATINTLKAEAKDLKAQLAARRYAVSIWASGISASNTARHSAHHQIDAGCR